MFTGLVEGTGRVIDFQAHPTGARLRVNAAHMGVGAQIEYEEDF